jgi:hypothetical protein
MAAYKVWVVSYRSIPIFHEAIYIEEKKGNGWIYHVLGGHSAGWQYETQPKDNIENSAQFYNKYEKGTIAQADLHKLDPICRRIAMPKDEYREGIRMPRDCRHWVQNALKELKDEGVFIPQ